jgi:DNA invertase Pin-like site-specific DNA recombinase
MSPATKTKPLIPYLRQSRTRERTISFEEQWRDIIAWAERHSDVSLAEGVEERGVSGSKPWRERELGAAIAACERGEASGIVVAYQSRLSRESGSKTAEVFDALNACGARLVCVAENVDTQGPGDPADTEMFLSFQAAIARREWRRSQRNFGRGKHSAWERGIYVASAPAGYEYVFEPGKLNATTGKPLITGMRKSERAEQVEAALRLKARGGSWTQVARALRGVPTSRGETRWTRQSARALARNPVLKGEHHCTCGCGSVVVRPEWVILPATVWAKTQPVGLPRNESGEVIRMGHSTREDRGKALLGGLLRCACCKGTLTPNRTTVDGKEYAFYQCRGRGERCEAPASVSARKVEPFVVRDFLDAVAFAPIAPAPPDLSPLEHAVEDALADVAKWETVVESGEFDPGDALRGLTAARERQRVAEVALSQAREAAGLNDERVTLGERWAEMSVEEQRRTMRRFGLTAFVARGKAPVEERVILTFSTDEYRNAATSGDFEPTVVLAVDVAVDEA